MAPVTDGPAHLCCAVCQRRSRRSTSLWKITSPNGRPALSANGVYFTDRCTVEKFEQMKVCTCLNPLHTALAVLGCMLGYERISDEMKDADLAELIRRHRLPGVDARRCQPRHHRSG